MTRHQLKGVQLKIARAEKQLAALNRAISLHIESNPYTLVGDFESETSEDYVVRAQARNPIRPGWAVVVGDITHNLRSALDHLAWQLAMPNPPSKTGFPVFLKQKEYNRRTRGRKPAPGSGLSMVRGMPNAARTSIRDLQPYRRAKLRQRTADSDPLWLLHELNRVDKHQVLQIAAFTLSVIAIHLIVDGRRGGGYFAVHKGPLKNGAEIWRRRIPGQPRPKVEMDYKFTPDIAFAEPGPAFGRPVIDTLLAAGDAVTTDVLPKLEPLVVP